MVVLHDRVGNNQYIMQSQAVIRLHQTEITLEALITHWLNANHLELNINILKSSVDKLPTSVNHPFLLISNHTINKPRNLNEL